MKWLIYLGLQNTVTYTKRTKNAALVIDFAIIQ